MSITQSTKNDYDLWRKGALKIIHSKCQIARYGLFLDWVLQVTQSRVEAGKRKEGEESENSSGWWSHLVDESMNITWA